MATQFVYVFNCVCQEVGVPGIKKARRKPNKTNEIYADFCVARFATDPTPTLKQTSINLNKSEKYEKFNIQRVYLFTQ